MSEGWRGRLHTARAAAALCRARLLIALLPFERWRNHLGGAARTSRASAGALAQAEKLARQVERAAERIPFEMKCLPRAIALSDLLRREGIPHAVVFAARPAEFRGRDDALHAWVEISGTNLMDDLPGPWIEVLRLGES